MVKKIWAATKNQRIALNMLTVALLLWPFGTLPRETISGFLGRKAPTSPLVTLLAAGVDWLCRHEPNHCAVTAEQESDARFALRYGP